MEKTNEADTDVERMQAVTISREYGSGGGEIAARLARMLGWHLLDHEAVVQVAHQLGISVADAEAQDEYVESLGMRLLNGLSLIQPPMSNAMQIVPLPNDSMYHETMRRVVEAALISGHVVIVGRGSQMLLKERRDILHVRVVAPLEQRIAYVMQREGLSRENALSRIRYKDGGRARYLQTQYRQSPADPLLYDLVINTAVLSLDDATHLIHSALAYKARRLAVRTGELGPGTGLPQYPGRSEDFTMPSGDKPAETT
jgi:cytidylate kinase